MNRTLAGSLEDLDLDEVIRVVALSRRSGVLTVESADAGAELVFSAGRLITGRKNGSTDTVGDSLVRAGVLLPHDLASIGDEAETLDDLLRRIAEERGETGIAARAEGVLEQCLRGLAADILLCRAGSFSFRLSESDVTPSRYLGDSGFTVPRGIDAEEIAKEARRRRQQGPRRRELPGLAGRQRGASVEEAAVELYVVDDDPEFRANVDRQAAAAGLGVRVVEHARAALEHLPELAAQSRRLMIVDLVMPRANGRGILGGLEVLRRAHDEGFADRIFLSVEKPHADAALRAKELGAAGVLEKPHAANGSLPSFAPFLNPVLARLGRPTLVDEPIDLVEQLRVELGEWIDEWRESSSEVPSNASSDVRVLKMLLAELNDPSFEEEIPLLVLRFASAFFARAAVFHAHEAQGAIVGVGAYGITSGDTGRTIHAIRLPIEADTVFTRAIRERQGVQQPFFESEWNSRLIGALGGPRPREVYTAPIFSTRGLEALLYADNATDHKPFPDLALLEIFLMQSGAAMERWSLKRRVEELSAGRVRQSA